MCWKIRHWNEYNLQCKKYSVQEITLKLFSLKLPNFWLRFLFPLVWWKTTSLWRFRGHSRTKSVGAWVSATLGQDLPYCNFVFLLILLLPQKSLQLIRTLFTVIGEIFLESFRLYKCQMLLLSPLLMGLQVEMEEEGRA